MSNWEGEERRSDASRANSMINVLQERIGNISEQNNREHSAILMALEQMREDSIRRHEEGQRRHEDHYKAINELTKCMVAIDQRIIQSKDNFMEHIEGHKWWVGIVISVAGLLSGIVGWITSKIHHG